MMGFTALAAQTILIREFFIAFNGNEFTIGIVLANWILLVALGSLSGGRFIKNIKRPDIVYAVFQVGIAVSLPVSIYLIRTLRNTLGIGIGETIDSPAIFASSLLIPSALGILMGASFPAACKMHSNISPSRVKSGGIVYAVEALGFIAAGPVITYILVTRFDSFSAAFITGCLAALSSFLIIWKKRSILIASAILVFASILVMAPARMLQNISINEQWKGRNLLKYKNSVYGNLAVTESFGQYTFYSNGIPIVVTPASDLWHAEDTAHFAMLSCGKAKRVMLIGGGAGGVIREILKYPVEKLIYVELDPALIGLIKEFPVKLTKEELSDKRLEIRFMDGRRAMLKMLERREKVDVIIVNLPAPYTLQLNRFYTKEFFARARAALSDNGIFECSLPGSLSALGPELIALNNSIFMTMKDVFPTAVIPGYTNIFLASEKIIDLKPDVMARRLEDSGIKTTIFNKAYIEDRLGGQWTKWFDDSIAGQKMIKKNSDLFPAGTYYAISYWNSMFPSRMKDAMRRLGRIDFRIVAVMILIAGSASIAIGSVVKKKPRYAAGWVVFSTGFTCMSLNLIIVYAYQSFHGFVFSHIALLVSAFMTGLALSSFVTTKYLDRLKNGLTGIMAAESAGILLCGMTGFTLLFKMPPPVYFLLVALPGFLIGTEFPMANKIYAERKNTVEASGILYSLDLLGSWGAALLVSFALVPLVGIVNTCLALALLKTLSLALVATSRH